MFLPTIVLCGSRLPVFRVACPLAPITREVVLSCIAPRCPLWTRGPMTMAASCSVRSPSLVNLSASFVFMPPTVTPTVISFWNMLPTKSILLSPPFWWAILILFSTVRRIGVALTRMIPAARALFVSRPFLILAVSLTSGDTYTLMRLVSPGPSEMALLLLGSTFVVYPTFGYLLSPAAILSLVLFQITVLFSCLFLFRTLSPLVQVCGNSTLLFCLTPCIMTLSPWPGAAGAPLFPASPLSPNGGIRARVSSKALPSNFVVRNPGPVLPTEIFLSVWSTI